MDRTLQGNPSYLNDVEQQFSMQVWALLKLLCPLCWAEPFRAEMEFYENHFWGFKPPFVWILLEFHLLHSQQEIVDSHYDLSRSPPVLFHIHK